MKTVIELAREVLDQMPPDDHCRAPYWTATDEEIERFAELVTEQANARANISWSLMCKKMVAAEREACAQVVDAKIEEVRLYSNELYLLQVAAAIRARSNT